MTNKKQYIFSLAIVFTVLFFSVFFANSVQANAYCANGTSMTLSEFINAYSNTKISITFSNQAGQAIAHINNTTGCSAPLIGSAYKMFIEYQQPGWLSTQQFIGDSGLVNINANGNTDLTIPIASCKTQVDVWYQTAPHQLADGEDYQNSELPYVFNAETAGDNLCTATPDLVVSCSANPLSIQTGNSINWLATASGGIGSYIYSWTGTDVLSGSSSSVLKVYSNSGSKTATVAVTSGDQSVTANCSATVVAPPPPSLSVTCSANPSSIQTGQSSVFTANATGGTGSYTYLWSGACTGTSVNCTNTFFNPGTQTANLIVTSGNQTDSATCSVFVNQSCTPNYQQRCVGNSLYWYDSCGVQGSYVGSCGQIYTNGNLTLTKAVRNLTSGSGFSTSTYANPSDTLMFMITVQANGNQDIQNVFVRDILPANLIYGNQLVVARSNNAYNNYSGDIISGINLNTIPAGQTVTITYQAQVAGAQNFSYGTTTLNNLASVTSSAQNLTATASAIVTRASVLGASTVSTGLTNNFWIDSFILPLIITLIAIWMWKSGMFFGIEKWLIEKK